MDHPIYMFNIEHSKVYTIVHISNGFSMRPHLRKITKIMCCHQTMNVDACLKPTFASEISKISKKMYKNSFWFYFHVEKVPWANNVRKGEKICFKNINLCRVKSNRSTIVPCNNFVVRIWFSYWSCKFWPSCGCDTFTVWHPWC